MNREILFRGKRVDNREWILGNFISSAAYTDRAWITESKTFFDREIHEIKVREVDLSTIGQYTGLIDKNGVKIFEGDVIAFKVWVNGPSCWVGEVIYDYGSMFVVRGNENQECESNFEIQLSSISNDRICVIGNIYDNPEKKYVLRDMMPEIYAGLSFSETNALTDALNRLAAYEDTGLDPEEITTEPYGCVFYCNRKCNLDGDFCAEGPGCPYEINADTAKHLLELAQAEKDGRLVVLPCKVGDKVYHITTCEHFQRVLDGTMYGPYGELGTATGCYCQCELDETCPFTDDFDCGRCEKLLAVFEDAIASILIDDNEIRITFDYSGSADVLDFGKTVFLTREEAAAALKKREADNEVD